MSPQFYHLAAFIISAVVVLVSTPIVKAIGLKCGQVDLPGGRKVHNQPMVRLGGVSIFLGALIAQEKLGKDSVVATVFSDDNKKYLSTDLLRNEHVKEGFFSSDITLNSFMSYKRVCMTCCDPIMCVEYGIPKSEYNLPVCIRREL